MAYVPPHKRHSKDNLSHSPHFPPRQTYSNPKNPRLRSSNPTSHSHSSSPGFKTIYAKNSVNKWFLIGSNGHDDDDDDQLPLSLQLHPVSSESVCCRFGDKKIPLILVECDTIPHQPQGAHARSGWEVVAAKVIKDLLSSFENLRINMEDQNSENYQVKSAIIARIGKVLFHGGSSDTQEATRENLVTGATLRQLRRTFYTNIPTSYMEKMKTGLPLEIGLELEYTEKDLYHVKLSDANRPEDTISCKCKIVNEQNKLQLYKIQLNQVRQMVVDFSCIRKSLDLRLMLCPKRTLTILKDDEMECIQNLIESAVIDPNVKGSLRWPLGKDSSGDRFSVVGIWHTITKAYRNPSLRLKVRDADRFDFRTSTGEYTSEVILILKEIVSQLQVQRVDTSLISKLLEENIKLIWDHFLECDHFLG